MKVSEHAGEEAFAEVNGTRLYYQDRGDGPALLLLHGFTLDHRMWRPQVEALSARYRVVAYDVRGFGRSAVPGTEPYRHCDDAAAFCEYLDLQDVVVVGHSVGGHQALEFALMRPDLVAGWVGIGTSGLGGVAFPDEVTQRFQAIRKAAREQSVDAAKAIWRQAAWLASTADVPGIKSEIDAMLADYSGWHWTHENPAQALVPSAVERLEELCIPALVITGGQDLPYNETVARVLMSRIGGATLLRLPNAGHMASMEAPDEVNCAIAELVDVATFDE